MHFFFPIHYGRKVSLPCGYGRKRRDKWLRTGLEYPFGAHETRCDECILDEFHHVFSYPFLVGSHIRPTQGRESARKLSAQRRSSESKRSIGDLHVPNRDIYVQRQPLATTVHAHQLELDCQIRKLRSVVVCDDREKMHDVLLGSALCSASATRVLKISISSFGIGFSMSCYFVSPK
jgi:hypothetical protein